MNDVESSPSLRCDWHRDVLARAVVNIDGQLRSGLFSDGRAIPDSLVQRHYGTFVDARVDPPGERPLRGADGAFVFGGYLHDHYGHFLLETLSRLWALLEHAHLPILWMGFPGDEQLRPWQLEILDLVGIDEGRHQICKAATQFEEVLVPQSGYRIQHFFHPAHARALAKVEPTATTRGKRLWLSRSRLPREQGGLDNERELERELLAQGWEVLNPEVTSVREQLMQVSSSEIVSGIAGSAFHSVMLLRNVTPLLMPVFTRLPKNENFETIRAGRGFEQIRIEVPEEALVVRQEGDWRGANRLRLLDLELILGPLSAASASLATRP